MVLQSFPPKINREVRIDLEHVIIKKKINGHRCPQCNKWKNGNLNAYAIFLERKYGHGILEELDFLYRTPKKFSREELLILIKVMDEMTHALPL
jgi:hypothetical protein